MLASLFLHECEPYFAQPFLSTDDILRRTTCTVRLRLCSHAHSCTYVCTCAPCMHVCTVETDGDYNCCARAFVPVRSFVPTYVSRLDILS